MNIKEAELENIIREETGEALIKKAIDLKELAKKSAEKNHYGAARKYINSAIKHLNTALKAGETDEVRKMLIQFKKFKNDYRL